MDLRLVPLPTGLDTRLSLHFRGQWVQEPGDSRPLSGRQHPLDVGGAISWVSKDVTSSGKAFPTRQRKPFQIPMQPRGSFLVGFHPWYFSGA